MIVSSTPTKHQRVSIVILRMLAFWCKLLAQKFVACQKIGYKHAVFAGPLPAITGSSPV